MSTSKGTTTRAGAEPADALPVAAMKRPPSHPGEIFRREFREALDPPVSQAEAARRLGWSTNRMNEFECGKRSLTVDNAIAIGELTGTAPEFWMQLQVRHELWHALQETKGRSVLAGAPFSKAV